MSQVVLELPLIPTLIMIEADPLPSTPTLKPVACVDRVVRPCIGTLPVLHILSPLSFVEGSSRPPHNAHTLSHVIFPLSIVERLVSILHHSVSFFHPTFPRAIVNSARCPNHFSLPMHLVIQKRSFVFSSFLLPNEFAHADAGITFPLAVVPGAIRILHMAAAVSFIFHEVTGVVTTGGPRELSFAVTLVAGPPSMVRTTVVVFESSDWIR